MKAKRIIISITILLLCFYAVSCDELSSQDSTLPTGNSENQSVSAITEPEIPRWAFDKSLEIASATLPAEIVNKAHIIFGISSATGPNVIAVSFRQLRVTQELIGWQEDDITEFVQNRSPAAYRHIEVQVNPWSEEIVKKTASTIGTIFDYNDCPDAVVPTADGLKYEINVNPDKFDSRSQPVETETVSLDADISVTYRPDIELRESRRESEARNIIHVAAPGRDMQSLRLNLKNIPAELDVVLPYPQDKYYEYQAWHGTDSAEQVLLIEAYNTGQFSFDIGIEIEGQEYGTIPCTVKILDSNNTSVTTPEATWTGNHGIFTTRVEPQTGETIISASSLMVKLTLDELIDMSDTIIIGKVVDIFPSRESYLEPWGDKIITDIVIEVQRYLYGESESPYLAVWIVGGRIGDTVMWTEDQPEFNLEEEVILFLTGFPQPVITPAEIEAVDYYRVAGAMQGKLGYINGKAINLEGESFSISEIEHKIALK
jgi:hypothetical protein